MQNLDIEHPNEVAAQTRGGEFRTEINAAGFELVADEPAAVGGGGEGPTPYDLLSAALASCTTMTLMMYARHKGIELESVTVRVRHDKIHAKDCEDCESKSGKIDEFVRELHIEGGLTDEQRQRMVEIADRCPVHKTMHGEVKIRTSLVGP